MDELVVGIVRTSFGIHGALKIESISGETGHLLKLERVRLRRIRSQSAAQRARLGRSPEENSIDEFRVTGARQHGSLVVLNLQGIESPEEARTWQGAEVVVERSAAAPKGPDEYYIADLVGCRLICDGREVATVRAVWESGAADMLEVTSTNGTFHVPFLSRFIGEVDTEARTIELIAPWVLE